LKILVINAGSSSLKYQFIDMNDMRVIAKGLCERIGIDGRLKHTPAGCDTVVIEKDMKDHTDAIGMVIDALTDKEHGVISGMDEISAVGHRVVHGGELFSESVVIDEGVKKSIEECIELAPLHNPANLTGIVACEKVIPHAKQVAVFDTAFHQTMPAEAYLYALPYEYYTQHKIRRYGFHGTSHKYVTGRAAELLGKPVEELKLITLHLGNGSSLAAVDGGKSVDTSMGFTPLAGLVMGTRSGDIDPAIVSFIAEKENLSVKEVSDVLNKKSGVLGLSNNLSSDFRDLEAGMNEGNEHAIRTMKTYGYHVAKYIGSYVAAMNGVDVICFTAGVGENASVVRSMVCEYLGYLGVAIDDEANHKRGEDIAISTPDSKTTVMVIPTNEELAIARETVRLV